MEFVIQDSSGQTPEGWNSLVQFPVELMRFSQTVDALGLTAAQLRGFANLNPGDVDAYIVQAIREGKIDGDGYDIDPDDNYDGKNVADYISISAISIQVAFALFVAIVELVKALRSSEGKRGKVIIAGILVILGLLASGISAVALFIGWITFPALVSGIEVGGKGGVVFRDEISRSPDNENWLFRDYPHTKPTQWELAKIDIWEGNVIDAIQSHWRLVQDGASTSTVVAGVKHGGNGGRRSTFELDPGEYIKSVRLKTGVRVDSIVFETNKKLSRKYGGDGGDRSVMLNGPVAGFLGRKGDVIDALGVQNFLYQHEMIAYGGDGGIPFVLNLSEIQRITHIYYWAGDYVDGIQFAWINKDGKAVEGKKLGMYGVTAGLGPERRVIELGADERLTGLEIASGIYVDRIVFHTNKQSYQFGGGRGELKPKIDLTGRKLLGLVGRYTRYIDKFGVIIE